MDKNEKKWKMVNITPEQIKLIQKLIKNPKIKARYGFRSVPDFVGQAIGKLIMETEAILNEA